MRVVEIGRTLVEPIVKRIGVADAVAFVSRSVVNAFRPDVVGQEGEAPGEAPIRRKLQGVEGGVADRLYQSHPTQAKGSQRTPLVGCGCGSAHLIDGRIQLTAAEQARALRSGVGDAAGESSRDFAF